jgi:hypothetical protein
MTLTQQLGELANRPDALLGSKLLKRWRSCRFSAFF